MLERPCVNKSAMGAAAWIASHLHTNDCLQTQQELKQIVPWKANAQPWY